MGWSWRAGAVALSQYPQLANATTLIEKWPSLRIAVENAKVGAEIQPPNNLADNNLNDLIQPSPNDVGNDDVIPT